MKRDLFELMGTGKVRRALMLGLLPEPYVSEAERWLPHAENIRKEGFERTRNWLAALAILVGSAVVIAINVFVK